MTTNMSAPLANWWLLAKSWTHGVVHYAKEYILRNINKPYIEDVQLDCDLYSSAVEEMIEQILSYGTQEQQGNTLRILTNTMSGAYQMGRLRGHVETVEGGSGGQGKSLEGHLRVARDKLSPVSEIKLEVVKEKTAELWTRKPEFLNNIHGTATLIMEKVNPEIRSRCLALSNDERANEPLEDLKIGAMQGWVRRAATALRKDGAFAGL